MFKTNYIVSFSDTDPGGILFFAEFFRIAHIAYEKFFASLNLERNYFLDDEFVIPIVHTEANYYSPVKFMDDLTVEVSVKNIGKSSFLLDYNLYRSEEVVAKILTKHVVVKKKYFKNTDIPKDLAKALKDNLL